MICLLIGSFSVLIVVSFSNDVIFYGTGEVKFISLEGGFFGIESDDGRNFDPINLPDEFKIDALQVEFTAIIQYGLGSIHMWGIIIHLLFIKEI